MTSLLSHALRATILCCCLCTLALSNLISQVNYTANDIVPVYTGSFHIGTNMGTYQYAGGGNWDDEQLAAIAAGDPAQNIAGVGVTTLRPALFEHFLERWGYDIRLDEFQYYAALGMSDHTVFVGYPNDAHTDPNSYCPGESSKLFANLYLPIWDGGANGTPYTDENYYAHYIYEMVSVYKDYVHYWEVWNEPDFSSSSNAWEAPGSPGSWWDEDPDPCDLRNLKAPIQHYIRLLRITYEIVKTLDPEAYVATGGIGHPSFLHAILRNTDNPAGGAVTADYPLQGGAYFDVLSFHHYPHISGDFRYWDSNINGWAYTRYSDAAAQGIAERKQNLEAVLFDFGYDNNTFPAKRWIITESNIPRKSVNTSYGSPEAQRNFIIKAVTTAHQIGLDHFYSYTLGDKLDYDDVDQESQLFKVMGLYENLNGQSTASAQPTQEGMAYRSMSQIMQGYQYDADHTNLLQLPSGIKGAAFTNGTAERLYILWAETMTDNSETAQAMYSFPTSLNWVNNPTLQLYQKHWDFAYTLDSLSISFENISLTGAPVFLQLRQSTTSNCSNFSIEWTAMDAYCYGDSSGQASITAINGSPPISYAWSHGPTSNNLTNLSAGTYQVSVSDSEGCEETQEISIGQPQILNLSLSGTNPSTPGATDGAINAIAIGGTPPFTYTWNNGSTALSTTNLAAGYYCLTITDANGCTAADELVLEDNPVDCSNFSVTLIIEQPLCHGDSAGIVVSSPTGGTSPYFAQWSHGPNGPIVEQLPSGSYQVTVTDAAGCSWVESFVINEPPLLELSLSGSDESAPGANDGAITSNLTGGTPPYNYVWNNGSTTANQNNLFPGWYCLTVIDANGCTLADELTIHPAEIDCSLMGLQVMIQNARCAASADGALIATALNANGNITYAWSTGDTTASINMLIAGTYTISITDAQDCFIAESFTITAPPELEASLETIDGSCGNEGIAQVFVSGGTPPYNYLWSNGSTDPQVLNLSTGTHSLTITDAKACEHIEEFTISNTSEAPIVTELIEAVSCNGASDGWIDLTVSSGTPPYSYQWNTGATTEDIFDLAAGVYTIFITDAAACNFLASYTITEPDALAVQFTSIPPSSTSTVNGQLIANVSGGVPPYGYEWSNGANGPVNENLASGLYELKVTDARQCIWQDSVWLDFSTSANDLNSSAYLNIYPNPAQHWLSIALSTKSNDEQYTIKLLDIKGVPMVQAVLSAKAKIWTLEVNKWPAGIYWLQLQSPSTQLTKKIVIVH